MKKPSGLLATAALAVGLALSIVPAAAGASPTFSRRWRSVDPVGTAAGASGSPT